ncbi:hypothetical protein [Thomasclavelia spiroformis]|uniref:hypothetical protein n=1 Tax=Thomasclavelia spiroformis TaxID=29348 RepID=UPI00294252B4|nr:hypothetical protein [Thomasclavelia spiroformis]
MIIEIYPNAIDCGISPFIFWNSCLDEIYDLISSYRRREKLKQKQRAVDNAILAQQIIQGIGALFSEKDSEIEIKQLWDYYPGVFEDEKKLYEKQKEIDEFEKFKEKRREFAQRYNLKIGVDG